MHNNDRLIAAWTKVIVRLIVAIVGGYCASLIASAVLVSSLSAPRGQLILAAQMVSFSIYAVLILWTFTASTASSALIGILLIAVISGTGLLLSAWLGSRL